MKIAKKALFLILCGMLCAAILSCAGMGGGKGAILATGEWMTFSDRSSDGGSSTATLTTAEEEIGGRTVTTYTVVGNVTTQFEYGFAGWGLDADGDTMNAYKTAKKLTFRIIGDGNNYSIKFKLSTVTDYAYHQYTFDTVAGQEMLIEVPMQFFMQPSWASTPVRFNPALVTGVEWQTHESWRTDPRNNPFRIKMWDFMIHR
ncbi:MAG: CIA30 family protein [Treponema sp.]|nr:CIA30 family protein [Treponema sp.]MCL2237727.1 CIA30 family protein [Treponema sp.]